MISIWFNICHCSDSLSWRILSVISGTEGRKPSGRLPDSFVMKQTEYVKLRRSSNSTDRRNRKIGNFRIWSLFSFELYVYSMKKIMYYLLKYIIQIEKLCFFLGTNCKNIIKTHLLDWTWYPEGTNPGVLKRVPVLAIHKSSVLCF